MKKVRITAKPKYPQNHIRINTIYDPVFCLDGHTLTSVQPSATDDAEDATAMSRPVAIPKGVDTILNGAFSGLKCLKSICFGNVPCRLGSGVFSGCEELRSAIFADGMENVPLQTFADCQKLHLVCLPQSVKRINQDAFKNCISLRNIDLPPDLEVIGVSAFWGCRSLEKIILPEGVTKLGGDAFANCTGLASVHLPSSLKKIGTCTFQNCISLEQIVIPEGVRSISMGAFAGCRHLRHIVIPSTLEYIHPYAFYKCNALETVECTDAAQLDQVLESTPFRRREWTYPKKTGIFPMELLNHFAGEVPGPMLSAMGYPLFDIDKKYRFFLTDQPGVIKVHARSMDAQYPKNAHYDKFMVDEALELIPDIEPAVAGDVSYESVF